MSGHFRYPDAATGDSRQSPRSAGRAALFAGAIVLIALCPLVFGQETSILHFKRGDEAPAIKLPNLEGQVVDLSHVDTAVHLVIFGHVAQERTRQAVEGTLNALAGDARILPDDRESVRVVLIDGANLDAASVRTLIAESWSARPDEVLIDADRSAFSSYGVAALPSMVIIGRDGRVIHTVAGLMPEFANQAVLAALRGLDKVSDEELSRALTHGGSPPETDEGTARARRHLQLASRLCARGMDDAAIAEYRKALEIDPGLTAAHIRIARLLVLQDELEDAEEHFQAALAQDPESAEVLLGLSWIALKQERIAPDRLDAIEAELQAALNRPNRRSEAYFLLGLVNEKRERWEQAAGYYRRSAERMLEHDIRQEEE